MQLPDSCDLNRGRLALSSFEETVVAELAALIKNR